jgi:hypothetical protein
MTRSLSIVRFIALSAPIAFLATSCAYERQEGHSDAEYYGAYVNRADYHYGYRPDEDTKAPLVRTRPTHDH